MSKASLLLLLVLVGIGLTTANFCTQYVKDIPNYALAIERSCAQFIALFAAWIAISLRSGA